jgi:hypothetical protein
MNNRKPHVLMLRSAAVLLVLVLLSTALVAGRYARYVSTASGEASARVAKFRVTESGALTQTLRLTMAPGDVKSLAVVVENDSEVTVNYTVDVENRYGNLPLAFALMDGEARLSGGAELLPGQTKELALRITWPVGTGDEQYVGKVDEIRLTVRTTQMD